MRSLNLATLFALIAIGLPVISSADESVRRLVPEDVYQLEGPQVVVVAPNTEAAAIIHRRIDLETRQERWTLRWADAAGVRPLEQGDPDARHGSFHPDGKWLAVRSTRPRPEGWKQTPAVPLQSDPATDIWLVSTDGQRAVPLVGPDKPSRRTSLPTPAMPSFSRTFAGPPAMERNSWMPTGTTWAAAICVTF